jgi:hypothetical protein
MKYIYAVTGAVVAVLGSVIDNESGWKTPVIINSKLWPQVQVTAKEILLCANALC